MCPVGQARHTGARLEDQPVIMPAGVLVNAGARTAGTDPGFTWSGKKICRFFKC